MSPPETMVADLQQKAADIEEQKRQSDLATKWLKAISTRRGRESKWRDKAKKVIDRYRDDRDEFDEAQTKFNILWANVEVLKPAIFARMPVADVRRRYMTRDPIARTAALILERSLSYCMDSYDFRDTLDRAEEDYLLPGRGQVTVCYKPYIKQARKPVEPLPSDDETADKQYPAGTQFDDNGAYSMQEEKLYEEVYTEYQPWDLYCFGEATQRCKVPWEAYGRRLTKDEVKEEYPDFKDYAELNYSDELKQITLDEQRGPPKVIIWKVWHKASRKMLVFAEGYSTGPIQEVDDPLQLEGFFPSPEPLYSIRTNGNDIPKPEFLMYQDQANELDILVNRQRALTSALKYRGMYDKQLDSGDFQISSLVKGPDNTFLPVANYAQLAEKGGIEALIDTMPLEEIAQVLAWLTQRIDLLKQEIYEVYGISDIVRGATKASETLGAQQLKAQYAGMRISTRQERFQRFIRDILRIKAEIIAEHFSPQTLQLMTGIDVVPDMAYQQMKQQDTLQANTVSQSEFMQACQLIKSDKLRGFRIDIETDSTVPVDQNTEQQNRVAFMTAVGQYLAGIMPGIESGMIPVKLAREGLLFVVRGFKVGTELEEVLEELGEGSDEAQQLAQLKQVHAQTQEQLQQAGEQNQKLQQDNQQLQANQQAEMAKAQAKAQTDQYAAQQKAALEQQQSVFDQQLQERQAQLEAEIEQEKAQRELAIKQMEAEFEMQLKEREAQHSSNLESLQASHSQDLEEQKASHAADLAERDSAQQESGEDKKLDALIDGQQQLAEGLHNLGDNIGKLVLKMAQPKTRAGKITGPSGNEYNFEMGES